MLNCIVVDDEQFSIAAMRGLLKKLRCDNYLNLVAASSIIRPGVAQSGIMKTYIERFNNPKQIEYLHPVMKEQLAETYGVMVYQEDVIKVCHHYGGMDLADADVLRRGMSGKFRSRIELDKLIKRFFAKAKALGRDEETTKEVGGKFLLLPDIVFPKPIPLPLRSKATRACFSKPIIRLNLWWPC